MTNEEKYEKLSIAKNLNKTIRVKLPGGVYEVKVLEVNENTVRFYNANFLLDDVEIRCENVQTEPEKIAIILKSIKEKKRVKFLYQGNNVSIIVDHLRTNNKGEWEIIYGGDSVFQLKDANPIEFEVEKIKEKVKSGTFLQRENGEQCLIYRLNEGDWHIIKIQGENEIFNGMCIMNTYNQDRNGEIDLPKGYKIINSIVLKERARYWRAEYIHNRDNVKYGLMYKDGKFYYLSNVVGDNYVRNETFEKIKDINRGWCSYIEVTTREEALS